MTCFRTPLTRGNKDRLLWDLTSHTRKARRCAFLQTGVCCPSLLSPVVAEPHDRFLPSLEKVKPAAWNKRNTRLTGSIQYFPLSNVRPSQSLHSEPLEFGSSSIPFLYFHVLSDDVSNSKDQEHVCYNPCICDHLLYGLRSSSRVKNKMETRTQHFGHRMRSRSDVMKWADTYAVRHDTRNCSQFLGLFTLFLAWGRRPILSPKRSVLTFILFLAQNDSHVNDRTRDTPSSGPCYILLNFLQFRHGMQSH